MLLVDRLAWLNRGRAGRPHVLVDEAPHALAKRSSLRAGESGGSHVSTVLRRVALEKPDTASHVRARLTTSRADGRIDVVVLKRSTPEEKEAKKLAKDQERAAQEQARADKAFWAGPAGQARTAFSNGDQVFQVVFDVMHTQTYVVPMSRAGTTTGTSDPTAILNAICNEGWELITGSFVFLEYGSESRDKFMRSGQQVAVSGTVFGYYLFRRTEVRGAAPSQDS